MEEAFILAWQEGNATILSNNIFFNSTDKPELSFSYDTLICESPTNVYFRMLGENQFLLSEEQVEECRQFCENYFRSGDYHVYAYDKADNNLYRGYILKSECEKKGYGYVTDSAPDNLTSSWNEMEQSWTSYYAVITDEGKLITNVSTLACPSCVLFLTEEEYKAMPARIHETDSWDFTTETWVDKRDLGTLKKEVILELRNQFEALRWRANSAFVPAYEQDTWRIQLAEAEDWKSSGGTAHTPYIDAFLAAREDADIPTKEELVTDIIANNEVYVTAMAVTNAKQWKYLKAIQQASDGYAVDALREEFLSYVREALA